MKHFSELKTVLPIRVIQVEPRPFYVHFHVKKDRSERDCPVPGCWEERVVREIMES